MQILIVEDNPDIRRLIARFLRRENYQVLEAQNGDEALISLTSAPVLPALILLDLMMPVKDGFEFRAEQLSLPRLAVIPVIAMSADVGQIPEKKARLQVTHYFTKPLDLERLQETIQLIQIEREPFSVPSLP